MTGMQSAIWQTEYQVTNKVSMFDTFSHWEYSVTAYSVA